MGCIYTATPTRRPGACRSGLLGSTRRVRERGEGVALVGQAGASAFGGGGGGGARATTRGRARRRLRTQHALPPPPPRARRPGRGRARPASVGDAQGAGRGGGFRNGRRFQSPPLEWPLYDMLIRLTISNITIRAPGAQIIRAKIDRVCTRAAARAVGRWRQDATAAAAASSGAAAAAAARQQRPRRRSAPRPPGRLRRATRPRSSSRPGTRRSLERWHAA
jgi:hypothetical protein